MSEDEASMPDAPEPYTYNSRLCDDLSTLPPHVQALCDTVLDDSFTVLYKYENEFQECESDLSCDGGCITQPCRDENHTLHFTPWDWEPIRSSRGVSEQERISLEALEKKARKIQKRSNDLSYTRENESEWDNFYLDRFFKKLEKDNTPQERHSPREARELFYYGEFGMQRNQPWTIFSPTERYSGKTPKPDISLHFKVHHGHNVSLASTSKPKARCNVARNFYRSTLVHLIEKGGLEPSPFSRFWAVNNEASPRHAQSLLGYPWFIAEYKRTEGRRFADVANQAANGAHCTLQMYSGLVMQTEDLRDHAIVDDPRIPPIVTMTSIGSQVHIWVAWSVRFRDPDILDDEQSRMQCIWYGDMRLTKDIIKLQSILDNTHTWAMRELRGIISSHLDRWLFIYPLEPSPAREPLTMPRTLSDPPTLPRTPEGARVNARHLGGLSMRSQEKHGKGKMNAFSARTDLFPNASTSKLNARATAAATERLQKTTAIPGRHFGHLTQTPVIIEVTDSDETGSEYEPSSVDDDSESEGESGVEHVSELEDSYESEVSGDSWDDAASFDDDRTPDITDSLPYTLGSSTPCPHQERNSHQRFVLGSGNQSDVGGGESPRQNLGPVTKPPRGRLFAYDVTDKVSLFSQ